MKYRSLGTTGIEVSAIGFGCGGRAKLMVGEDESLRLETISLALELGVTYFDTAAAYGEGRSERNLGRALRILQASPVVSTKVAIQAEDLRDPRSAVLRNYEQSLARLGMDSVDILMLHNRVFHDPSGVNGIGPQLSLDAVLGSHGVAEGFKELLAAGAVRAVGFTAYGGAPYAIRELIATGVFGAMNASFSAVNPSALVRMPDGFEGADYDQLIADAAAAGMGVMAIQVLGRGALIGSAEDARRFLSDRVVEVPNERLTSLATRYVLSKPEVSTAIMGISAPAHVQDATQAADRGELDPSVQHAFEAVSQNTTMRRTTA